MRCGTNSYYVTVEKNNKVTTHRVAARSQVDARKIIRANCGDKVQIKRVEKRKS